MQRLIVAFIGFSVFITSQTQAARLNIYKDIEEQSEMLECDIFDWFRSCKQPSATSSASGYSGFITNGSRDTAEYIAKNSARDMACDQAREKAKALVPECQSGCYSRFFVLEACKFTDEAIISGEGEADEWFEACRLKFPNSTECDEYNSGQQFWAVVKVNASAQVSRLCEKETNRCQ
jgi:hypothetical protein